LVARSNQVGELKPRSNTRTLKPFFSVSNNGSSC
jgi:hypothetical protein